MSLIIPDFSDLFDILHTELSPPVVRRDLGVRPKTDILETDNEVTILSELPGLTKDQVGISLENNRLTISGQTKRSREYEVEGVRQGYKERTFSSFSRSFNVPSGLKAEEIKAGLENGVLKVTFPKNVEKPEAKKIEILSHL